MRTCRGSAVWTHKESATNQGHSSSPADSRSQTEQAPAVHAQNSEPNKGLSAVTNISFGVYQCLVCNNFNDLHQHVCVVSFMLILDLDYLQYRLLGSNLNFLSPITSCCFLQRIWKDCRSSLFPPDIVVMCLRSF